MYGFKFFQLSFRFILTLSAVNAVNGRVNPKDVAMLSIVDRVLAMKSGAGMMLLSKKYCMILEISKYSNGVLDPICIAQLSISLTTFDFDAF